MFRDTQQALKQLEQQLLLEDETPLEETTGDLSQQELDSMEKLLNSGSQRVIQAEADEYEAVREASGKLRNYANRYQAYNSDITDTDLNDYSEEVRNPRKKKGLLLLFVIILLLLLGILCVLAWWLVRFRWLFV